MRAKLGNFDTLASRLALVLAIGTSAASVMSFWAAERYRDYSIAHYRAAQVALSTGDIALRLKTNRDATVHDLKRNKVLGAKLLPTLPAGGRVPPYLAGELNSQLNDGNSAFGRIFPAEACIGDISLIRATQAAGFIPVVPECWVVSLTLADTSNFILAMPLPTVSEPFTSPMRPFFLLVAIFICSLISLAVAHLTLRFMGRLREAASQFAMEIDTPSLPEGGPADVRATYAAFNSMQKRIRAMIHERTEMLASVSHDLKTPLTRLRLRTEALSESPEQHKILADLDRMEQLVHEGLLLASSHESNESWASVDLESLLASLVDDERDAGRNVTLGETCNAKVQVKTEALIRCLQNLIDNAVFYGGDATISSKRVEGSSLVISISDNGPGIPDAQIESMFLPFKRGDRGRARQTGGTGIGLTIARAQAATFGGTVALHNRRRGGLEARIAISATNWSDPRNTA